MRGHGSACEPAPRRFGARVRTLRLALGLSQEALGFRADLHRTYVSDIERGRRNPSLLQVLKLARALGVSVGQLVGEAPL
ncbi:MAG TPA: helix-turn-helix transcriptional regulator [Thermodesulfobacteriota bacterium]